MDLKKRLVYLSFAAVVLAIEIIIGVYLKDGFIRPFLGDVLVSVLLCLVLRLFLLKWKWLPIAVFGLSLVVELTQLIRLDQKLRLEGTVAGIILGSTFDYFDILCYLLGCFLFWLIEYFVLQKIN